MWPVPFRLEPRMVSMEASAVKGRLRRPLRGFALGYLERSNALSSRWTPKRFHFIDRARTYAVWAWPQANNALATEPTTSLPWSSCRGFATPSRLPAGPSGTSVSQLGVHGSRPLSGRQRLKSPQFRATSPSKASVVGEFARASRYTAPTTLATGRFLLEMPWISRQRSVAGLQRHHYPCTEPA